MGGNEKLTQTGVNLRTLGLFAMFIGILIAVFSTHLDTVGWVIGGVGFVFAIVGGSLRRPASP